MAGLPMPHPAPTTHNPPIHPKSLHHPLRNATSNPLRSRGSAAADLQHAAQAQRKMILSAAGMITCAAGLYGVIKLDLFGLNELETKSDKNPPPKSSSGTLQMDGPAGFPNGGPSVITIQGQDGLEQVPTGTSTIPHFPSTIRLPTHEATEGKQAGDELAPSQGEEYQLLGLGIRTVSFLSIQVYVVGLYVAKPDITTLQQRLIRTAVHPPATDATSAISGAGAEAATSLVPLEREQLRELLLDAERGDAVWSAVLKDDGVRTAFRIVPTRNTDFMHLRDGWVRGITARAQAKKATATGAAGEFQDERFGTSMNDFKSVFGAGKGKAVPKGQTLVLMRDSRGVLDALFQPGDDKPVKWMGRVEDERISRLVWLNYLAGKSVASEGARTSIVDGLMRIVERPLGTVVQKVI
ncbi:Chalcone isomerase [Penicillium bovifimosum]|uniref:Chalcone isomerase n=1 Tax=Penicillium bovifimosum TaxID=126998 RepID=A0A9W9GVW2_9EURO|nr:Chalcone isomerase [Penicillium bovifimosum]KAJ5130838.1 Chalcone isomerase [Penicillium bovifimosum]